MDRSARSSRRGNSARGRRSISAGSVHTARSGRSKSARKSTLNKSKTNLDMTMGLEEDEFGLIPVDEQGHESKNIIKPHDIYKNTMTMPNKELRLLHVQVNGSLFF
jgi:hypothetical protein